MQVNSRVFCQRSFLSTLFFLRSGPGALHFNIRDFAKFFEDPSAILIAHKLKSLIPASVLEAYMHEREFEMTHFLRQKEQAAEAAAVADAQTQAQTSSQDEQMVSSRGE